MNFWQQLQNASGMAAAFPWVVIFFIVGAAALFILRPLERMRIRTAVLLFAFGLVGLIAAAALVSSGVNPASPFYKWIRWAARFFEWIALVNVAGVFIFEVFLDALRLKPPRIMRDLLLALSYIVVAITILSRDVDLTGIIATSAVLTAVIGLSFQDTLGNMMGGMALQMERTIGVGDWIRFDGQEGLVREIRWRHTSIETRNWDTLVNPNSALMKSQVTILGRRAGQPRQHRQWVYFNVDFRYSPADVIDVVQTALRAEPIPNLALEPQPNCVLMDFKESYGSYAVRYWLTDLAVDDPTNSIVRTRIYFALRRANIPLSIPAHSLFVTEEDQSRLERKRAEEIDGQGQEGGGVVFTGHLAHGLEIAELQGDRFPGNQRSRLHHFLGGLKFALGIDDLGPAFALSLGLSSNRSLHILRQVNLFNLHQGHLHTPGFGLRIENFLDA